MTKETELKAWRDDEDDDWGNPIPKPELDWNTRKPEQSL